MGSPGKNQCRATNRAGERCKRPAIQGGWVCAMHGGAAPQVKQAAQLRLIMAADLAAAEMIRQMTDKKATRADRREAAKDIMNRAGLSGKVTIEHTGENGGPIRTIDLSQYSLEDLEKLQSILQRGAEVQQLANQEPPGDGPPDEE